MRPFHERSGDFGRLTFATTADTQWEINGGSFAGAAGLDAVAALAVDTPVVAQGMVVGGSFTAATVLAGSSVPWSTGDALTGVVTARVGDTLTVRDADVERRDGADDMRGEVEVLIGDDTRVRAIGAPDSSGDSLGKGAISVGQRIVAFGTMVDARTLDATAGWVRLEITGLEGSVVQVNPLVVDLVGLGGLPPGAFDFAGTGATTTADANPTHYEIDTATLSLPGLAVTDRVRVRGLVHAFALAPPDFDARTVIVGDDDPVGAHLRAVWPAIAGSASPFTSLSADRIDVDLTDARHQLIGRDAPDSADHIALIAPAEGGGAYLTAVRGSREVKVYRDFAELTHALSDHVTAGEHLVEISANGRYNAATLELTTPRASFEFTAP